MNAKGAESRKNSHTDVVATTLMPAMFNPRAHGDDRHADEHAASGRTANHGSSRSRYKTNSVG